MVDGNDGALAARPCDASHHLATQSFASRMLVPSERVNSSLLRIVTPRT